MLEDPEGRMILETQPRILNLNINELMNLKPTTFGHKYAEFMNKFSFKPEERPLVKNIDDYELAYVKQRYKEIHDFIHTILGYDDVSILSELKVKHFEMVHFGLPVC